MLIAPYVSQERTKSELFFTDISVSITVNNTNGNTVRYKSSRGAKYANQQNNDENNRRFCHDFRETENHRLEFDNVHYEIFCHVGVTDANLTQRYVSRCNYRPAFFTRHQISPIRVRH